MQQRFDTHDGRHLTLRPVREEDAGQLQMFFAGLSAASRRCRFHGTLSGISDACARRLSQVDSRREVAFVSTTRAGEVVAEARYSVNGPGSAEFAIAVGDRWTGLGVARRLMSLLVDEARAAGLHTLHGDVLADNNRMLNLMQRCGFQLSPHPHDDALLRAEFDLAAAPQNNGSWWAALAFLFPARAPFFQAA